MTRLTVSAPAKLNLFLHITGRRADGYHELQTLFQLLDFGDTLHFEATGDGELVLEGPELGIAPEDNLILRAARLLRADPDVGVRIRLNKRIPTGGGLGGGSSDAATTLLALNRLWQLGHSNEALQAMGRQLGADVPVFVAGHSAWAEGVGERLTSVELPERWYLVISPGCHVATGEIFNRPELTRNTPPITIAAFFAGDSRNDCQTVVRNLYPEVDNALIWLEKVGDARLTGTGACVFASFQSRAEADAVQQQVPAGWTAFVARGVNRSPVLEQLV